MSNPLCPGTGPRRATGQIPAAFTMHNQGRSKSKVLPNRVKHHPKPAPGLRGNSKETAVVTVAHRVNRVRRVNHGSRGAMGNSSNRGPISNNSSVETRSRGVIHNRGITLPKLRNIRIIPTGRTKKTGVTIGVNNSNRTIATTVSGIKTNAGTTGDSGHSNKGVSATRSSSNP